MMNISRNFIDIFLRFNHLYARKEVSRLRFEHESAGLGGKEGKEKRGQDIGGVLSRARWSLSEPISI